MGNIKIIVVRWQVRWALGGDCHRGVPHQTVTDKLAAAWQQSASGARSGQPPRLGQLKTRIYTSIIGSLCLRQRIAKWSAPRVGHAVMWRERPALPQIKNCCVFNQSCIRRPPQLFREWGAQHWATKTEHSPLISANMSSLNIF